eukprot:gene8022-9425_t
MIEEAVASIEKIQDRIQEVSEETRKKSSLVEKKYNEQLKEQFKKRDILIGKTNVPNFWSNVITMALIDVFDSMDQTIVDLITDFKADIDFTEDTISKKITFTFKENPYFENKTLSRQMTMELAGSADKSKATVVPAVIKMKAKVADKSNKSKGKRKESEISQESFILKWLSSSGDEEEGQDAETLEDLVKIYQDPFSILAPPEEEDSEDESGDDQDGGDQFDEDDVAYEEEL